MVITVIVHVGFTHRNRISRFSLTRTADAINFVLTEYPGRTPDDHDETHTPTTVTEVVAATGCHASPTRRF